MNSIVKRFGKSAVKFSAMNFKKMFTNFDFKAFSYLDGTNTDLSFGAKKVATPVGTAGGVKVKNVSSGAAKAKVEAVVKKHADVADKKKKAATVTATVPTTTAGKKKVVQKVPEEPVKVSKVAEAKKTTKAAIDTKKKTPVKKQHEEIEEEEETEHTTEKKLKTPKKAAHTMQTQPSKGKKTTEEESHEESSEPATKQKKRQPTPAGAAKKKSEPGNLSKVDLNNLGRVGLGFDLDLKKYTQNPEGIYEDYINNKSSERTKQFIKVEREYICNNYAPLPVICERGKGIYLQDVDGFIYIDFLSAYSAVNHGHSNQNIIKAAVEQMNKLHMTSRAFYNTLLGKAGEMVCKLFNYEKALFMNSGVEAGESAVKIARRWGYVEKGISLDHAKIVFAKGNFWGRSLYACATSDDPSRYYKFGPFPQDTHYMVKFGDIEEITTLLESDPTIAAVFLEPIQGEGGVVIPPQGYLTQVQNLCKKHNVLLILDEIQTGIGRTGYLLASNMENVQPDMTLLGKSLSGGLYPISAVLTSRKIMDVIKPGEHGSTYGGNPLAAQIVLASMQELFNQPLIKNSYYRGIELGLILREELEKNRFVKEVRGRGLMYAVELWPDCGFSAYDFSLWLMERGILCKPTKQFTLRLSPPLMINSEEVEKSAEIISYVLNRAQLLNPNFMPLEAAKFNIASTGTQFESDFINSRRQNKLKQMQANRNVDTSHVITPIVPTTEKLPNIEFEHIQDTISQIQVNVSETVEKVENIENVEKSENVEQEAATEPTDQFANVPNPFQSSTNVLGLNLEELTQNDAEKEAPKEEEANWEIDANKNI